MSKTRIVLTGVIVVCLLKAAGIVAVLESDRNSIAFAETVSAAAVLTREPGGVVLKSRSLLASNIPDDDLQPLTQLPRGDRRRLIVQLGGVPDAAVRQALEAHGVRLLHYIGSNAWYAAAEGGADSATLRQQGVRAAWRIEAADRLAPGLYRNRIPRHAVRKDGSISVNVETFNDADLQAVAEEIRLAGGVIDSTVDELGMLFVHIPPQFVWSLGLI